MIKQQQPTGSSNGAWLYAPAGDNNNIHRLNKFN